MPRRRRAIARSCTAVLILAAALYLINLRWGATAGYVRAGVIPSPNNRLYHLYLDAGCVGAGYYDVSKLTHQPGWRVATFPTHASFRWWMSVRRMSVTAGKSVGFVSAPLWMVIVASGVPGVLLWRSCLKDRARHGHCPWCSYDRTGLAPSAPCPECGRTGVT